MHPPMGIHAGCAHAMGMPWVKFLRSCSVYSQPRQRTRAPSRPPREDQSLPRITATAPLGLSSPCPALFPLLCTGQPPRRCWLESTQHEQGFGLAPWSWSSRAMFFFHKNPPTSSRQTNLEMCSCLQRQQPHTSHY